MEYTFWPAIRFDNSFLLVIGFGGGCVLASYLTVQSVIGGETSPVFARFPAKLRRLFGGSIRSFQPWKSNL